MKPLLIVVILVCTVGVNMLYHKIFDVTYFGCRAVLTEWIVCIIIGYFLGGWLCSLLGLL